MEEAAEAVAAAAAVAETETMNPFDLRGPEFLVFYVVYIAVLFLGVKVVWKIATARKDPPLPRHPYEIAFLRGGAREAAKVAVLSLLQSRVVFKTDKTRYFAHQREARNLTEPLDRSVVQHFQRYVVPDQAKLIELAEAVAPHYKQRLVALGLWASGRRNVARLLTMLGLFAAIWIVAGMKMSIAFDRGHSNVGFLIGIASIATFGALAFMVPAEGRTIAGDEALATLRALNKNAGGAGDLVFYAAIFGAAAVALEGNPFYDESAAHGSGGSGGGSCGGSGSGGDGGGGGGCGGCGGGGGGGD